MKETTQACSAVLQLLDGKLQEPEPPRIIVRTPKFAPKEPRRCSRPGSRSLRGIADVTQGTRWAVHGVGNANGVREVCTLSGLTP